MGGGNGEIRCRHSSPVTATVSQFFQYYLSVFSCFLVANLALLVVLFPLELGTAQPQPGLLVCCLTSKIVILDSSTNMVDDIDRVDNVDKVDKQAKPGD